MKLYYSFIDTSNDLWVTIDIIHFINTLSNESDEIFIKDSIKIVFLNLNYSDWFEGENNNDYKGYQEYYRII